MFSCEVSTDYNGIVVFSPTKLKKVLGRDVLEGEDLLSLFFSSDLGEDAIVSGAVLPVLAIDDAGYDVEFEWEGSSRSDFIFENGIFPLDAHDELYIADLVVLREWSEGLGWQKIEIPKGYYAVTVKGFNEGPDENKDKCGYLFSMVKTESLPCWTSDIEANSRVL